MLEDWKQWSTEKLPRVYLRMSVSDPFIYSDELEKELARHGMFPNFFEAGYIFCLGMAYGKHVERLRRQMSKRAFLRRFPRRHEAGVPIGKK